MLIPMFKFVHLGNSSVTCYFFWSRFCGLPYLLTIRDSWKVNSSPSNWLSDSLLASQLDRLRAILFRRVFPAAVFLFFLTDAGKRLWCFLLGSLIGCIAFGSFDLDCNFFYSAAFSLMMESLNGIIFCLRAVYGGGRLLVSTCSLVFVVISMRLM